MKDLILHVQVSWHWKSIVELDQLWMPKCLRLGWSLNFSQRPNSAEQGVWKRHYIQTVQELRLSLLQVGSNQMLFDNFMTCSYKITK